MYYIVKQELSNQETSQTLMLRDSVAGPFGIKAAFTLNGFMLTEAKTMEEAEAAVLKRKLLMALFADVLNVEVRFMSPAFESAVFTPLKEQLQEKLKSNNTDIQLDIQMEDVEEIKWGFNLAVPLSLLGIHDLNASASIDYSYTQSLDYVSISEPEYKFLKKQFGGTYGQCLLLNTNRLMIDGALCQVQLNIKEKSNAAE